MTNPPASSPSPPSRKIPIARGVALAIIAVILLHAVSRILAGDILGQFELAILFALLIIAVPIVFLAKFVARTRLGRFIHADARTTTLIDTKRFKLQLRDEPNNLLVVQAFVLLLFLLMLAIAVIGALVRLMTR